MLQDNMLERILFEFVHVHQRQLQTRQLQTKHATKSYAMAKQVLSASYATAYVWCLSRDLFDSDISCVVAARLHAVE